MKLKIDDNIVKELKEYCKSSPVREVCGAIIQSSSKQRLIKMKNIAKEGAIDYIIDPKDIASKLGDSDLFVKGSKIKLIGLFHSHPFGQAFPSAIDFRTFALPIPYLIYSVRFDELNAFLPIDNESAESIFLEGEKNSWLMK